MFKLRYILFLLGFRKKSRLLSVSEPFSKNTIQSDIVKKLNTMQINYSYRIDQQKFGRIIIVCARVRLGTDDKPSTKQWFAYKETQAGVMSWELT
tara:strand:+ start:538 stop:822 length:285 start_codon:yes stop_codon:yes gene_type:complete